jgi:ABC-2 type transport system permease protein
MRALLVARKSLLEMAREWHLLGLVVLLPLAFLGITAFGYSSPLLVTHPVLAVSPNPQDAPLIEELRALRYADGRPMFDITQTTDRDAAETALKEQTATALITVAGDGSRVTLRGDPLYGRFYRASTILESAISRYADRLAGRPEIVQIVEEPLGAASPQSEFDVYAPGMMIFALLLIIPQTAMLVAREMRWGTLRRLRLACLRAWELLAGVSVAQMVIAVIQVVVILVAAGALGFHSQGSLWLAIVVGLIVSFSAVGMGLVVACFVENDSQAINVGSTVTMLQVFLSGSFFQLPPLTVFTLAGHQIDLFDVFPATHGFLALQQVLSYGAGLREVSFRLGMALALSVLYFGVGVAVFQRLQMKEQV